MTSPSIAVTGSSYLDIQAALGITKHNGGLSATLEILRLCRVAYAGEVLYVGSRLGWATVAAALPWIAIFVFSNALWRSYGSGRSS